MTKFYNTLGFRLAIPLLVIAAAASFIKPLYGEPLTHLEQVIIICTAAICMSLGGSER